MLKKIYPILLTLAVLLAACAPKAEPTMAPADVQGTAVSAAWTMVAATQMAIPTNTALPPTEVPSPTTLPTFTPPPAIPTLEPLILPTATSAASSDSCNKPLNVGEAGPTNPMRIENGSKTGGTIQYMSAYLNTNTFGQCGYLQYNNIGPGATKTIALPKGEWYFWAGMTYKNGSSGNAKGPCTIRIGDEDMLRILVSDEVIRCLP